MYGVERASEAQGLPSASHFGTGGLVDAILSEDYDETKSELFRSKVRVAARIAAAERKRRITTRQANEIDVVNRQGDPAKAGWMLNNAMNRRRAN